MFLEYNNRIFAVKLPDCQKSEISNLGYEFVKTVASKVLQIPVCNIDFEKYKNGKPCLKKVKNFHFNISHSEYLLIIAFSNANIGVDVEIFREINLKITDRFFAEEEKEFVKEKSDFFYVWTRKEAFIKQTGEGLKRPLSSFNSLNMKNIKTFELKDGFISVCNKNAKAFTLEILEKEEFLNLIKNLKN